MDWLVGALVTVKLKRGIQMHVECADRITRVGGNRRRIPDEAIGAGITAANAK
jgi:hypothetical protein